MSVGASGRPFEVSGAAGLTVYRIVQEALTNALKHAEALGTVEVGLAFDDPDVSVRVVDDGRTKVHGALGGNGHAGPAGGGHGVAGMAERAAAFGGTLDAGPARRGAGRSWPRCATARRPPSA